MKWVTRQNVGVDRMGCAWLILGHIDPKAQFLFVEDGARSLPAGAEPFDIPGATLSHHQGHCSFYAILQAYKLKDPVLQRLARIIDEADTIQDALIEPAGAGLDLICRGLRRTSADDRTALARGRVVYDALYAELAAEESK